MVLENELRRAVFLAYELLSDEARDGVRYIRRL
jgi:hypothetical protein